jgi:MtN3 and saliva related transmembrane protein
MIYEIAGIVASFCSALAYFPQVIKTFQQKESVKDLALGAVILPFLASTLWILYGIGLNSKPLIITNLFQFVFSGILLFFKLQSGCPSCSHDQKKSF